jgi:hypothetical protein
MNRKGIAYLQLATAIGTTLFWVAFFAMGFENPNYPSYYSKFEHSFPLPDSFMIAMLLCAYFNRNNEKWKFFTLIAAGAMIFLGLCDFSFNFMNGMYSVGMPDSLMNAGINIWSVGFGVWQIRTVFKTKE